MTTKKYSEDPPPMFTVSAVNGSVNSTRRVTIENARVMHGCAAQQDVEAEGGGKRYSCVLSYLL
jgi:hypothetical protein